MLKILALLSRDNFFFFVVPMLFFGLCAYLCVTPHGSAIGSLAALGKISLFMWVYVLSFNTQHQIFGVEDDRINKPYRVIPSGLATPGEVRKLFWVTIPALLAVAFWTYTVVPAIILLVANYLYNERGWDQTMVGKIVLNTVAYGAGFWVAAVIGLGEPSTGMPPYLVYWVVVHTACNLLTIAIQDLRDTPGDKAKGRQTMNIQLGEPFTRRWLCFWVSLFSVVTVAFWSTPLRYTALVTLLALWIGRRLLTRQGPSADHLTFQLYILWVCLLILAPSSAAA
jgi:4-hydroxybenzoate polyprenyltransferase